MIADASQLLTVVIAVHNRATLVRRTLESLQLQTVTPSVVLVDNNSTDGTLEVLKTWSAACGATVSVCVETTPGAPAARNCGLLHVTTPYVMFFDSDDTMAATHIERVVKAIEDYPDADVIGWDVERIELDGHRRTLPFADKDMLFRHTFNAVLSTQRYVARTQLIRCVGAWDESLPGWNDYELGMRLLASSPRVVKISGARTVTVYSSVESITGVNYSRAAGRWEKSLRRCMRCAETMPESRQLMSWFRLRWAVLAALYAREGEKSLARETLCNAMMSGHVRNNLLMRLAFEYTRRGGRGIHLLLRKLL